jgi:multidrug resistance efflux pump
MRMQWAVVLAALGIAGLVAFLTRSDHGDAAPTSVGRIEPEAVIAAATLGGRVKSVHAQRGQHLNVGDVLVRFEADELDARMKRVQEVVALAPLGVIATTASFVERVPPSMWASLLQTDPVRLDAEREYVEALAAVERDGTPAARARLNRAQILRVSAIRRVDELRPQALTHLEKVRAEAESTMSWLSDERQRLDVKSPVSGVVELLDLKVGDRVMPGTGVALLALPGKWVVTSSGQYPPGSAVEVSLPNGDRIRAKTVDPGADGHVRIRISTTTATVQAGDLVGLRF